MMRITIVSLLLILSLTACVRESRYEGRVLIEGDTEELSRLIWQYVTPLKYERRVHLENSYVCSGPDHSTIHMEFISQDLLELCEARQLLVDIVEGFLWEVNRSRVAGTLRPYPFTADQMEIYIEFESFYGLYIDPNYVGRLVLEDGMSYFYTFSVKDDRLDIWQQKTEPYFKSRSFALLQREAENDYKKAHPTEELNKTLESLQYHPKG